MDMSRYAFPDFFSSNLFETRPMTSSCESTTAPVGVLIKQESRASKAAEAENNHGEKGSLIFVRDGRQKMCDQKQSRNRDREWGR